MYDLKTVHGKSSVDTQLLDSIGQANIREDTLGQSYIRNFMMKYRQK